MSKRDKKGDEELHLVPAQRMPGRRVCSLGTLGHRVGMGKESRCSGGIDGHFSLALALPSH